jgi:hypothetical protein
MLGFNPSPDGKKAKTTMHFSRRWKCYISVFLEALLGKASILDKAFN